MRVHKIILLILMLVAIPASAQFIDIDWSAYERDTLLPRYSTAVELGADYDKYTYTATIEYPEFSQMTYSEACRYRLSSLDASLTEWPVVESSVQVSAKKGFLDVSFVPIVCVDGKYKKITSFKLVVAKSEKPKMLLAASRASSAAERYTRNSVLSSGRWVKIRVDEAGVYRITHSELSKMGFKNPDKVRLFGYGGHLLPEKNIHNVTDDLKEVPLWRENSYMLFYANGTINWEYNTNHFAHRRNHYSLYSYYFLNESDDEPMAFPKKEITDAEAKECSTYPDYLLHEKEKQSMALYGRVLLDDYNYANGRTVSYGFKTAGAVPGSARVSVSFGTNSPSSSKLTVGVNGETVSFLTLPQASSGDHGKIVSGTYSIAKGIGDETIVTLVHSATDALHTGYLDYIALNYTRSLALRGSFTNFRGSASEGNSLYKIASANNTTKVWCVTQPHEIAEYASSLSGTTLSVVAPASRLNEYVAVDVKGSFPSVQVVKEVQNQNLHSLGTTDMVIIVPSSGKFLPAAERLAEAHRTHDNLSVAVVTAEQVYNEFSSGTPDATAYRRLMKMLYDRASSSDDAPKYLLLFGDGVSDNRLITYPSQSQDDLLLCYESENSVNAIYSYVLEDYYGFLDDSEGEEYLRAKVDIGVGRIPAKTISEANGVVDKIIAYMRNDSPGLWQNIITMLGDDGDKDIPNQHMIDAEAVASYIEANSRSFVVERIYWDDYPMEVLATGNRYPLVNEAIKDRIQKGTLLVNYSGHGGPHLLSHEMSWTSDDMGQLSSPIAPFWVTASCDIAPFDIGDGSIGEVGILNPNGAAIGLLATTRTVLQTYNAKINQAFTKYLFTIDANGKYPTVGDALRQAKCALIANLSDISVNKLQYVLLGDPALCLNMPDKKVVVEKFNGADAEESGTVSAGGSVTVEGYIANNDGSVVDAFNGLLSPTLFDCAEVVTTRNNTNLGAYNYTAFRKKLFVGSDSVVNGRFKITMPVPMDISYADEQGMLNLFAYDSSNGFVAQGYYENFVVGGTSPSMNNDGKGPEISMYLNSPYFINGDEVNASPYLFVELYDENGINTVGTGVGHDIVAMVDNERTYNLNSLFVSKVGNYKRGVITLPMDRLPSGEHTIVLRVWDLFNNSSTDTLTFVVNAEKAPTILDIKLSPSPLRTGESALIEILHDSPNTQADFVIELFTMQGQKILELSESCTTGSSIYSRSWNVEAQGGTPMLTGLYIIKARMVSLDGTSKSVSRKIIVLNNK